MTTNRYVSPPPTMTPAAPTTLHEARLEAVLDRLVAGRARRIADLGCGRGALLDRLAGRTFVTEAVAVDLDAAPLDAITARFAADDRIKVQTVQGSLMDARLKLGPLDAAVLLEVIEHIRPEELSKLEIAVFRAWRPRQVIITTPNAEANDYLGVPRGRRRHWDHWFEWGRERFQRWATGVAARSGYRVEFEAIGSEFPSCGAPTQMAVFTA
ncbi:MAG: methyltransferase domain-containing protein [Brevundimonas sp.]|uniref:methyltransferase domain-containing protein n=1 Tax=Brevundimonas sp. TaxID=1871086 RepID=UPI00271932B2|nr:methyltransferase domain-containing protein [Brevundimonas sp.]MDO9586769.1 methyltransferase domain-containing protein [Brevundimonas sp.]MDP3370444.1 methyltransferase domain-containing protein [Brevundimonas sp.]MDP3657255.1 methyltransferase domain-containing protein [Brevundimonas sp.]MDZ4109174.1 methyltransferase domain-containing protein [Brevundimonas sp.]